MEDNSANIDLCLDDFINGKITEDELKTYFGSIGIVDYQGLVDEHRAASNIVQRYNVLQYVNKIHEEYIHTLKDNKAPVFSLKRISPALKIAAVVTGIFIGAATFFAATTSQNNVYSTLTQEYHVQINRAEATQEISPLVQAFNNKEFALVIAEFRKIHNPDTRELFLSGYAFLQTNQYNAATGVFTKILERNSKTTERLYQDEAEYYLVLSSVKEGKYDVAYKYADLIYNDKYHTYNSKISRWLLFKLKWLN